ncbi:hypothetical protein B9Y43_12185 [Staphylococcus aureus]|nr:hypothetical protein B9Y43_12185 [Staphylococcus aureus]
MIHCFFKFIWQTLAESHLKRFTLRAIMKFPIKVQFPKYVYIPQTHFTNPPIIQTIILNKQNISCLPHKLFSSL